MFANNAVNDGDERIIIVIKKEPSGLCINDGKRPDGLTLIPWQGGKPLVWDATVVTPLTSSYVDRAATGAGVVSDLAADRKLDTACHQPTPSNPSLSTTLASLARQRLRFFLS